jgi:hypothetical protein
MVLYGSKAQICYSLIEIEFISVCCFCSALYILDHVMHLYSICPVDCDGHVAKLIFTMAHSLQLQLGFIMHTDLVQKMLICIIYFSTIASITIFSKYISSQTTTTTKPFIPK